MELTLLEDFLSLAECAHFSRAAELRHMTQPAFSRRIRALEEWVGTPLFDRAQQPVTLTEAGIRFLPAARKTLLRLGQVREECREADQTASATLRFYATHCLSLTFFPGWLRALEVSGPLGAIRLNCDSLEGCEQAMAQGQTHFMLSHHLAGAPSRLDDEHFMSVRVGEDVVAPLCAVGENGPGFTLPGTPGRPVPLLAYGPESNLSRMVLADGRFLPQSPALEPVFYSHLVAILKAVALEGRGVAWLPLRTAAEELRAGTLVRCGDAGWDVAVDICLIRARAPLPPGAERFWTLAASLQTLGR
jgi:DNA-binding transcriptional LysR family regulator